ncbi:hypothetical protein OG21DRAFT_1421588 [Imleria badia]|nr:hypothetical protein OG21DRAFT_1421588 [Imleria badia]
MSTSSPFITSFYIGIQIENILYGIELFLYFETIRILLRSGGTHKKSNLFYALFSSMMVFLTTIWIATQAIFGQNMWLLDADFPGGPDAYWQAKIGIWYMDWATMTVIVLQLMTDALMIHRCRVIWNSYRAVAVPILLWLATLTLGVVVAWVTSAPGSDYYTGIAAQLSLAYWSVSVFLNTTLTCMICYRVLRHGKIVQEHLGNEYASLYFAVVTLIVESVLPYTLSGIAFLVTLGVGSPTSTTCICVYFLMMCISPQILILRVVAGKAWSNETFSRSLPSVKFSPESGNFRTDTAR